VEGPRDSYGRLAFEGLKRLVGRHSARLEFLPIYNLVFEIMEKKKFTLFEPVFFGLFPISPHFITAAVSSPDAFSAAKVIYLQLALVVAVLVSATNLLLVGNVSVYQGLEPEEI